MLLVDTGFITWHKEHHSSCGTQRVIPSWQHSHILKLVILFKMLKAIDVVQFEKRLLTKGANYQHLTARVCLCYLCL